MGWGRYTQGLWENHKELNTKLQASYSFSLKVIVISGGEEANKLSVSILVASGTPQSKEGGRAIPYAHNNPKAPAQGRRLKAQEDRQAKLSLREAACQQKANLAATTRS